MGGVGQRKRHRLGPLVRRDRLDELVDHHDAFVSCARHLYLGDDCKRTFCRVTAGRAYQLEAVLLWLIVYISF